jgi:hypothetical protein
VLHHGVGIDLADGAEFLLGLEGAFVLVFVLAFSFAQKAADHVADGAEPALTLEAGFVLVLHFLFAFPRVLIFEFMLDQFTLGLISHDDSSCSSGRRLRAVT